jgi:hypothetical protein
MRVLKILGILLCALALVALATAGGNNLGIRDSYRVFLSLLFTSETRYYPQEITKSATQCRARSTSWCSNWPTARAPK